jgi:hypothetical protein
MRKRQTELPRIDVNSQLVCPVCQVGSPRDEWRRVFRFLRGSPGLPPVMVLRHTVCNEIAYFLVG